jgi:hypothetical protein
MKKKKGSGSCERWLSKKVRMLPNYLTTLNRSPQDYGRKYLALLYRVIRCSFKSRSFVTEGVSFLQIFHSQNHILKPMIYHGFKHSWISLLGYKIKSD